ncbi:unnamed protein product [Nesidiocoris tenuis]|uniref:DUF4780 domain-containing protein n=1 Tax=Nesidiocoris tenuis TaxID=355587 RepID=A0A6H5HG18_9HEMI|nr:unnamed protein product [Nesidiocoris tenuis]
MEASDEPLARPWFLDQGDVAPPPLKVLGEHCRRRFRGVEVRLEEQRVPSPPVSVVTGRPPAAEGRIDPTASGQSPAPEDSAGAAKRRLRYLRKHGVGGEEARKLALLPVASQPTHYKRGHSSSGSTPDQRAAKRPRHQGSSGQTGSRLSSGHRPVSYSAAVGSVRLGIVNDDFPEVHWTDEQLNVVRMALARWIISNPADAHPLSFLGLVFRRGWLLLTCEDAATAAAVRAEVPRLRPWEGARLRVLAEADFPRTRFAAGYFPFSSQLSTEEIMSSVIGQNREEDLRTREWRVVQRSNLDDTAVVTLAMDDSAADGLARAGGTIRYLFERVTIKQRRSGGAPASGGRSDGGCGMEVEAQQPTEGSESAKDSSLPPDRPRVRAAPGPSSSAATGATSGLPRPGGGSRAGVAAEQTLARVALTSPR